MNFQQLKIIREAVRQSYNLTVVANALFTSQSGVSKHIKDLEQELGLEIFVRKGKRLTGLTEPGKELVGLVERILLDAGNVKRLAEQFSNSQGGRLTIATTHSQARYVLPAVVARFRARYPAVHLAFHQSGPEEIGVLLRAGEADIGIATEGLVDEPTLRAFPYYEWRHAIVAPSGHPLTGMKSPSLADLARYPIITYHEGFTGRAKIDRAFAQGAIVPEIVMSALDADVIKTYVELGLGIGIIASMAYDPRRDGGLELIEAPSEFSTNTTVIAVRRGSYLRGFAYRFIELCSPSLSEASVRAAIALQEDEADAG